MNSGDNPPMRVLIVRLDHLGDVLLTTPLIRAATTAGHEVHVLVRENCAAPFAANPSITLHLLEQISPGFPRNWWRLGLWMRRQHFDILLLPYAKPSQLLLASALSGAKQRIAMWGGILGRLTLHHCLRSGMRAGARHFSDIPLDCARAAGIPIDGQQPDFPLTPAELDQARADFDTRFPGLKLVGIHPGCAGNTCNLPSATFGQLASLLLQQPGIAVIATGIPSERPLFDSWPPAVLNHPRFYNACGQWSLRQLAAHVAHYATMVVPSTGPLHIAAAYSIPTVSAFCCYPPVSAAVWGNLTPGTIVVSPPADFCQTRRAAHPSVNCDFQGQVQADQLHRAVLQILARTAGENSKLEIRNSKV
jgi:heptosyltransferase-2/heptosyltransferase-3